MKEDHVSNFYDNLLDKSSEDKKLFSTFVNRLLACKLFHSFPI